MALQVKEGTFHFPTWAEPRWIQRPGEAGVSVDGGHCKQGNYLSKSAALRKGQVHSGNIEEFKVTIRLNGREVEPNG